MRKNSLTAVIVMMAITMTIAGCAKPADDSGNKTELTNKDWFNTDIVDTVTEDMEARIQDDFNLAVNKDQLLKTTIPDGARQAGGIYDVVTMVDDKMVETVQDQTLTSKDAKMVRSYYDMIMDWDTRNSLSTAPAKKYVDEIRSLENLDQMTDYLIHSPLAFVNGNLINFYVDASFEDPDSRMISICPPSLSMEDAAEYREMTENGKIKKDRSTAVWTILLNSLGFSEDEVTKIIGNTFRIETMIAGHKFTVEELNSPDIVDKFWNPCDIDGLQESAGNFPVKEMLKSWGAADANLYNIEQTEYLKALDSIYCEENFEALKDWLTVKMSDGWENLLDQKTRDDARDASNEIQGIKGVESDEKSAMKMVRDMLPVPMDNMYVEKYCTPQLRDEITEIINSVVDEYRSMLQEEDWLSEETRNKAVEKLENIRIRAVYPDQLGDWSDLKFETAEEGGNLLDATLKISEYSLKRDLAEVNEKIDREAWDQSQIPASTVNAYYSPGQNSINILAGILNGSVYQSDFTYEEKLGTIGTIIGHEISHAFDPTGSQFDKDGAYSSWWTDEDREAFGRRAEKLINYYNQLEPLKGVNYSGSRIQGEAIADLGGFKCMLRIASGQKDFDYKKFFEAYAHMWLVTRIESLELNRAMTDSHPLGYLRVNAVVQQFDEFYDTYDVREGDGMYLAPEDRICVW